MEAVRTDGLIVESRPVCPLDGCAGRPSRVPPTWEFVALGGDGALIIETIPDAYTMVPMRIPKSQPLHETDAP